MSKLDAFLNPAYFERKIKVILGDRFIDENGEPVPVVMKSLTQEQLNSIARSSVREQKVGGKTVSDVDPVLHLNRCLIESIVEPDLRSKELCDRYNVVDPVSLIPKLFLVDEYEKLARAFATLNGLKEEDGSVHISGEITKN